MSGELEDVVRHFVAKIRDIAKREAEAEALKAVAESFGSTPARRPRTEKAVKGFLKKGQKRTSETLTTMTEKLFRVIDQAPGRRAEQIAKAMGAETRALGVPIRRLLDEKRIRKTGSRRGTQYFPAK